MQEGCLLYGGRSFYYVTGIIASLLINMHYCNYTEPYGSEKVTYDGSDDHTDKLDPWFAAVVDEQSGNDCHYDKSDDISTCRSCQFRRTTSETGEYREPNKTDQKIDQITDGSFFPSEKIQGQINRQIGE